MFLVFSTPWSWLYLHQEIHVTCVQRTIVAGQRNRLSMSSVRHWFQQLLRSNCGLMLHQVNSGLCDFSASTKFRTLRQWNSLTPSNQMIAMMPKTNATGSTSDDMIWSSFRFFDGIKGFDMVHDNNVVRKDTPSQSGSDVCKRPPWSVSKPAPKAHRIQNQHVNLPWFCLTRNNGMVRH